MLVLIDESGCPGFKLAKASTPFFTLAMVIFKNLTQANVVDLEIKSLREQLRIKQEFKFSKAHPNVKDQFFEQICQYDFQVKGIVIDKNKIYSPILRSKKDNFYNYFLKLLISHADQALEEAIVRLDGSGSKVFQRSLKTYIRREIPTGRVKQLKFIDSKRDCLIQLADMVVGAIARSNLDVPLHDRWLRKLQQTGKIQQGDIWYFGK